MNPLKLRQVLTTIHLWLAGLLAPFFLIVAISGGLDLAGVEAKAQRTPINLPADASFDFGSKDMDGQMRTILAQTGTNLKFEYVRARGNSAQTRPTSRPFVTIEQTPGGLQANMNKPNLQYALMELHKGHGPKIFRIYQIIGAIALFFVIFGGVMVGLLAKTYRLPTLIAVSAGTLLAGALILL